MKFFKKFILFIIALAALIAVLIINLKTGLRALNVIGFSFKEMALVLPPLFILLGLLDVWVPKEKMMRYMGEGSGIKGIILAIIIGSVAAGPLYAAFPVAAALMRKGVKFTNILIFIGAWSTTKIPMLLFEISALGARFAMTRLAIDIFGIIIIAYVLYIIVSKREVKALYYKAENL
ncbi:MAG: permease [Actinobacteria bacterium RBG_13_35_12]|nr:MAG: permease [Actinobacteria bacterium RBG_13_35_12]